MRKHTLTTAVFFVLAGSGAAVADDDCHLAMDQWQPREAVQKMAEARGWTVRRIRADDGCYQIDGKDASGQSFEATVHPATLEVLKIEQEKPEKLEEED